MEKPLIFQVFDLASGLRWTLPEEILVPEEDSKPIPNLLALLNYFSNETIGPTPDQQSRLRRRFESRRTISYAEIRANALACKLF